MQAHSSVEKAGLIGLVKMRLLKSDEDLSLRGTVLREAIADDKQRGLIPFYVRHSHAFSRRDSVSPLSCSCPRLLSAIVLNRERLQLPFEL